MRSPRTSRPSPQGRDTDGQSDLDLWLAKQTWPDARRLVQEGRVVAYRHPYGFIVCRLEDPIFNNWQVRLHLWPTAEDQESMMRENGTSRQQVHCHGWTIKSQVLVGALIESTYDIVEHDAALECLYQVQSDYGTGASQLALSRPRVEAQETERWIRDKRSGPWEIFPGNFHRSASAKSISASVVLTSLYHQGQSYVVGPQDLHWTRNARSAVPDLHPLLDRYDAFYAEESSGGDQWASFVFVMDQSGCVLMVRARRRPDVWVPVGGRSEPEDTDGMATAIREVGEEVGLHIDADQLSYLGTEARDTGPGQVFFWAALLDARPQLDLQDSELWEAEWVPAGQLPSLELYKATQGMTGAVLRLADGIA